MRTDEELKTIATDLYKEKIFCDKFLNDPKNELTMVFMAFIFLDDEARKELQRRKPVFFYEYMHQATGISFNGYPTFHSCSFLNEKEYKKMNGYYKSIKSAMESI